MGRSRPLLLVAAAVADDGARPVQRHRDQQVELARMTAAMSSASRGRAGDALRSYSIDACVRGAAPRARHLHKPADRPPSIAQSSVALCSATSTLSATIAALRPR